VFPLQKNAVTQRWLLALDPFSLVSCFFGSSVSTTLAELSGITGFEAN
jgi:hypothetical protein